MTEQGVVLSVKNEFAKVRVGRNSACASCGKCGMTERQKHVDFYASNTVDAQEGDTVVLNIPDTNSAKLAFVAYMIPLVPALGLLFMALGLKWADWTAALLFMGGLAIGFAIVALIDRLRRHKWMESPKIVEIVRPNVNKSESERPSDEQTFFKSENSENVENADMEIKQQGDNINE